MDSTCVVILFLFSFTLGQRPLIQDLPCDDILEENTRLKAENAWLKDVIRDNITQLAEMIQSNSQNIQDNTDNLGIVEIRVTANDGNIVSTNRRIDENKEYIEENRDIIDKLHLSPIGTILAWVTKPSKETRENEMVSLPDGWVRCDGSTIPEPSVWAGQLTPNLNGEKRFLRGASDSEVLTLEEDQMQDHKHNVTDPGHSHSYIDKYPSYGGNEDGHYGPPSSDTENDRYDKAHTSMSYSGYTGMTVDGVSSSYRFGTETRPKNMNVIYIMRVW